MKSSLATHAARYVAFLASKADRPVIDPDAFGRLRRRIQSEYRAAQVKRKGGPTRQPEVRATKGPGLKSKRVGVRRRRASEGVTAICLNCSWRASGPSWRPVKRQLREHKASKHLDLVS